MCGKTSMKFVNPDNLQAYTAFILIPLNIQQTNIFNQVLYSYWN
jgi:hypothetical protein